MGKLLLLLQAKPQYPQILRFVTMSALGGRWDKLLQIKCKPKLWYVATPYYWKWVISTMCSVL